MAAKTVSMEGSVGPVKAKIDLATDGLVTRHVIMIEPNPDMSKGFTTVGELGKPDFYLALEQHRAYATALRNEGVKVDVYPATKESDQHFVEDMASVFRSSAGELVAVVAKPATSQRSLEVEYVVDLLANYLPKSNILRLPDNNWATIEFGDVVRFGGNVIVGQSKRTNASGLAILKDILAKINPSYTVSPFKVDQGLHADTVMSPINKTTLIGDPAMNIPLGFKFDVIILPNSENYAASVLPINHSTVIMPTDTNHMVHDYPFTATVLGKHFENVVKVSMSEFHKMDGSLRCLKLAMHWDGI